MVNRTYIRAHQCVCRRCCSVSSAIHIANAISKAQKITSLKEVARWTCLSRDHEIPQRAVGKILANMAPMVRASHHDSLLIHCIFVLQKFFALFCTGFREKKQN
jgi:hypothetical protein